MNDESLIFMRNGDITIELVQDTGLEPARGGSVHLAWEVEDLESQMAVLEEQGLIPIEGPLDVLGGWKVIFYEGPGTEMIELIERRYRE